MSLMLIYDGINDIIYKSTKYYCSGETIPYTVNWSGTTSSGWIVPLNDFWFSGHCCLNVSIYAINVGSYNT